MSSVQTEFKISAKVTGAETIASLQGSVKRLASVSTLAGKELKDFKTHLGGLYGETLKVGRATKVTENQVRAQIAVLRDLKGQVDVTSDFYRKLANDIKAAEQRLASFNRTENKGQKRRQTMGKVAQGVGAVAGAAVFGGPEGAVGSLLGAPFGLPGMIAGGALGAQVGMVRKMAGEAGALAAEMKRLKIAMKAVAGSAGEYALALQSVDEIADEFNVKVSTSTRSFTKLLASIKGAGGDVEDAKIVFKSISAAIKATGGNAEDVKSALLAMSQIFSKSKVSAEELQGQLGERLPGAVTTFAEATNRNLPQMQKDLKDGVVDLNDSMKFVIALSKKHRKAAMDMSDSMDDAGARMDVALDRLSIAFGDFFKPVGAGFQTLITQMANMVTAAINARKILLDLEAKGKAPTALQMKRIELNARARAKETIEGRGQVFQTQAGPATALWGAMRENITALAGNPFGAAPVAKKFMEDVANPPIVMTRKGLSEYSKELTKGLREYGEVMGEYTPPTKEDGPSLFPSLKPEDEDEGGGGRTKKVRDNSEQLAKDERRQKELLAQARARLVIMKQGNSIVKLELEIVEKIRRARVQYNELLHPSIERTQAAKDAIEEQAAEKQKLILLQGKIDMEKLLNVEAQKKISAQRELNKAMEEYKEVFEEVSTRDNPFVGMRQGLEDFAESLGNLRDGFNDLTQTAIGGLLDGLTELATTGRLNFQKFARDMMRELAEILIRQIAVASLMKAIGLVKPDKKMPSPDAMNNLFNPTVSAAKGAAFGTEGQIPVTGYAKGGVFNKITPFAYGGSFEKLGVLGEAGPEAVMPLKRGRDGRLGVEGGGDTNVVVNVDATGSKVEGNENDGRKLGQAISVAVRTELVKQRRPGGLLA